MKRFINICGYTFTRRFSIFAYILIIAELVMCALDKYSMDGVIATISILFIYNLIIIAVAMFSRRGY
jgi:hypothetical protein